MLQNERPGQLSSHHPCAWVARRALICSRSSRSRQAWPARRSKFRRSGLTSRARTCHVDPVLRTCATLTSSASSIRSARAGDQLVLLTKSATSERPIPVVSHTGHSISRRRHPIPASSSCSLRYYVATRLGWFANGGRMRICCRRWWAGLMTTGLQIA